MLDHAYDIGVFDIKYRSRGDGADRAQEARGSRTTASSTSLTIAREPR
jgi:hypothetical protein